MAIENLDLIMLYIPEYGVPRTQLTVGVSANWSDIDVVDELTGLRAVGQTAGEDVVAQALDGEGGVDL